MTIKLEAWQALGVKTNHCVDKFEFCCWQALLDWLNGYGSVHKCPKCQKKGGSDGKNKS